MDKCFFTNERATVTEVPERGSFHVKSSACGHYIVAEEALSFIDGLKLYPAQGLLNCARKTLEINSQGKILPFWVVDDNSKDLEARPGEEHVIRVAVKGAFEEEVDHASKPFVLLESFAKRLRKTSAYAKIEVISKDRTWARICDDDELKEILQYLQEAKLIKLEKTQGIWKCQMTVDGWAKIRERTQGHFSNKVFIAVQFDWQNENDLLRQVIDAIQQACHDCGYEANVVDQKHTGFITDQIIAEIKKARFVISELSYNNRGVYYESGYARALGIQVFHVVNKDHIKGNDMEGKRIHFDIAQINYLEWSDPKALREELRARIEANVGLYRYL